MSPFRNFASKNKRGFTLIVLLLISFFLLLFSKQGNINSLSKVGFTILSTFQNGLHTVSQFFINTVDSISQLNKIQKELEKTREDLEHYKKIILDVNQLNNENLALRRLLELKDKISFDSIACRVIARDPQKFYQLLIVNKGSRQGIKENMTVISYVNGTNALIGKTVAVTPFSSKIMTLNHPDFRIGVSISSTNTYCIIQGEHKKTKTVKLLYVPKDVILSFAEENIVYTSGDSLFYPKGIKIGKVTKIIPSKRYEIYNEAEVETLIDLSKIEYVLILKANIADQYQ